MPASGESTIQEQNDRKRDLKFQGKQSWAFNKLSKESHEAFQRRHEASNSCEENAAGEQNAIMAIDKESSSIRDREVGLPKL